MHYCSHGVFFLATARQLRNIQGHVRNGQDQFDVAVADAVRD